jgi:hypothetical protein
VLFRNFFQKMLFDRYETVSENHLQKYSATGLV